MKGKGEKRKCALAGRRRYIPLRYIFAALLSLLEVCGIIGAVAVCCYFVPLFYLAALITQVLCVIRIIASDDNPDYKLPWLLFVLILPVAGFMLYFMFYSRKLQKKYVRRLHQLQAHAVPPDDGGLLRELRAHDPGRACDAQMLCRIADTHLYGDTKATYYASGEALWQGMLADLAGAQRFVLLEYFIIAPGDVWSAILDILIKKAANGVEIRVVYDDIGCMTALPGNYADVLAHYGIHATPFSRLRGNADSEFNNRNHRKLLVIDGRIGYTGGMNLSDEYVNRVVRFGHWKDVGLRLEGRAVYEMTRLFLIDYGINVKGFEPDHARYLADGAPCAADGLVIPFGDGPRPLYPRRVSKSVIRALLDGATRYAWITTPYLILDNELCLSLEGAALRGVDVRVILPHVPDKRLIFAMSRSFYPRLLAAGVRIYEYTPGFMHAKIYLADGTCAMVGSANLDYRSMVHHFENGVWMYGCDCIKEIRADLEQTLTRCTPIVQADLHPSRGQRLLCAIFRIFAPLL